MTCGENFLRRVRPHWLWLLLSAVGLVCGCASSGRPVGGHDPSSPHRLYAVISAFGVETRANEEALLGTNAPASVTVVNGVPFKRVTFEDRDLLLFPSGVSMVNAAMTTQLALDRFPVTHILFAGIAGGINPARHIGDVVVPEQWAHHSEAAYFNQKADGSGYQFDRTFRQRYENFGFMFPENVRVVRDGLTRPQEMPSFPADAELLAAARRAESHLPPLTFGEHHPVTTVGGIGISGPVFMDNREYREWAFRVWHADCLDMESTAIAQVCWANRRPFLIVRSLSDLAGEQDGPNAEDITEGVVSKHASVVLREIIRELPK